MKIEGAFRELINLFLISDENLTLIIIGLVLVGIVIVGIVGFLLIRLSARARVVKLFSLLAILLLRRLMPRLVLNFSPTPTPTPKPDPDPALTSYRLYGATVQAPHLPGPSPLAPPASVTDDGSMNNNGAQATADRAQAADDGAQATADGAQATDDGAQATDDRAHATDDFGAQPMDGKAHAIENSVIDKVCIISAFYLLVIIS
jgi:hypothetical protein